MLWYECLISDLRPQIVTRHHLNSTTYYLTYYKPVLQLGGPILMKKGDSGGRIPKIHFDPLFILYPQYFELWKSQKS